MMKVGTFIITGGGEMNFLFLNLIEWFVGGEDFI